MALSFLALQPIERTAGIKVAAMALLSQPRRSEPALKVKGSSRAFGNPNVLAHAGGCHTGLEKRGLLKGLATVRFEIWEN